MSTLKLLFDAVKELFMALVAPIGNLFKALFGGTWTALGQTFKFQSDEIKRPLLVLVSIIIIVVSLISIFFSMRPHRPSINVKPYQGLGEVAAKETIKLVGDRGTIVILNYDNKKAKSPVFTAQLKALKTTLARDSHITIKAEEGVDMQPMMADPMGGLSADAFIDLVTKYQDVDAIISFVGTPYLKPEHVQRLPKRRPKIISAASFAPHTPELVSDGVIQVAITPRFQPPGDMKEPETPQEWFDKFYTVVTSENVDQMPTMWRGPAVPAS